MSSTVKITAPVIARVPGAQHEVLVSEVALRLREVSDTDAPVRARLLKAGRAPRTQPRPRITDLGLILDEVPVTEDKSYDQPFRVFEGRVYGRRHETKGEYSHDEVEETVRDGRNIVGMVGQVNAGAESTTYFNGGYFLDGSGPAGGYGDVFAYREDCDADALLKPLADEMRANAARSIVVGGEIYSPCSGPVLAITQRSSARMSGVELEYGYSNEVLGEWTIRYDAHDVEATLRRVSRHYAGDTTISAGRRLEVAGEFPPAQIPVHRMLEAQAARIVYFSRNTVLHDLGPQTIRDLIALRGVLQRRWPDTVLNLKPPHYYAAFDYMKGRTVPDAAELLPYLEPFLDNKELGYTPAMKAQLIAAMDYVRDDHDLQLEMDEIAEALSI